MGQRSLGRTNLTFPPVWLALVNAPGSDPSDLVSAALESRTVLDLSSNPALWGGFMRGTDAQLLFRGGADVSSAVDEKHAADLMQAGLIQHLCSIGREHIDFYCLQIKRGLEEYQLNGALQALEEARQDGHVRFIGLSCEGPALAALGAWQFHDAFDIVLVPRSHELGEAYSTLQPLAAERRVGVVTTKPFDWGDGRHFWAVGQWGSDDTQAHDLARLKNLTQGFYGLSLEQAVLSDLSTDNPVVVEVSSGRQTHEAIEASTKNVPAGLGSMLQEFRNGGALL